MGSQIFGILILWLNQQTFVISNITENSLLTSNRHIISPATQDAIKEAGKLIVNGELIAFPTETVYGLGGDATNDKAIAKIFSAKERPKFNPLIVHFHHIESVKKAVLFDDRANKLSSIFWPGALTLVLPRAPNCKISLLASAGLGTIAVRVPQNVVAKKLIEASGSSIAAPSANFSGTVSPTDAAHVANSLPPPSKGGPAKILDGGRCTIGLESTVIDLSTKYTTLLRPGGIPTHELESVVGPVTISLEVQSAPKSPGMALQHYAPSIPLRMNALIANPGEALLGFGPNTPLSASANLSPEGNLLEAATNLFAMIRALDKKKHNRDCCNAHSQ